MLVSHNLPAESWLTFEENNSVDIENTPGPLEPRIRRVEARAAASTHERDVNNAMSDLRPEIQTVLKPGGVLVAALSRHSNVICDGSRFGKFLILCLPPLVCSYVTHPRIQT